MDAPGPYLDLYPSTPLDGTQPYPSEIDLYGVKALKFWYDQCTSVHDIFLSSEPFFVNKIMKK